MSSEVAPGPTFAVSAARVLFKTGLTGEPLAPRFVVTGDGHRFLFNVPVGDRAPTTSLQVALDWAEGLAR